VYDKRNLLKCSYEYTPSEDNQLVLLNVESRAHILHAFVNNEYVGKYEVTSPQKFFNYNYLLYPD
jgi:hypothetical protein